MQKLLLMFLVGLLAGCAAPRTATAPDRAPQRGLMGIDDAPLTEIWKGWQASDSPSTPTDLRDAGSAFDYWQITDDEFTEEAWSTIFAVLTQFRGRTDAAYDDTFRTLMTALEEPIGTRRFDLTFVVSNPGSPRMWEGIIARVYRELPEGGSPGVSVLLRRWEGGGARPEAMTLWFFSGFEEARSLSASVDRLDSSWSARLDDGIVLKPADPLENDTSLVATVLEETFWPRLTGNGYMDSPIERREKLNQTPAAHPIAAGLQLGDRDIDQVFSDSVFAPRLTTFPSKTNP